MTWTWDGPSSATTAGLLDGARPTFARTELASRRAALAEAAEAAGCDLVLVYGAHRAGTAVGWLTGWETTREAALLVDLDNGEDQLLVQFHNHVPLAEELADGCDVRWGGPSTAASLVAELQMRRGAARRLGVVGPIDFRLHGRLAPVVHDVIDLGPAAVRLRLIKSDAELDWLAAGAHLSDIGALALAEHVRPGINDRDLIAAVEHAWVRQGGTTHVHYLSITSMDSPNRAVPAQVSTGQVVGERDVVVCELSGALGGYAGQVLRTMTTAAELAPLFAELHAVADAAFDAVCAVLRPGASATDVVAAAGVIEDAGYTTVDDLVHGFGGGYLPPVIGSASRPAGPLPTLVLAPGMTVVVQPNVTTLDRRAGVQTGELMVITDTGARRMHTVPRGPWTGLGAPGGGAAWR